MEWRLGVSGCLSLINPTNQAWRTMRWSEFETPIMYKALVAALNAIESVGLDFGGVDVMINSTAVAVCEINTSPSIDGEFGAKKYGDYFKWIDSGEREHWNYSAFRASRSLFWKNSQLKDGQ